MRTTRRAAAAWLPLVACAAAFAGSLAGCASDEGGLAGGSAVGGGVDASGAWPDAVPRPDLPLVEETDLVVLHTATFDLAGGSVDDYLAQLAADGFARQWDGTWSGDAYVVVVESDLGRMIVTITDA